jgi:hypothetical protein
MLQELHTILDERAAAEVGGVSGPALARAIRDGTSDPRNEMVVMALRAAGLGGAPPGHGRSSCPTTG